MVTRMKLEDNGDERTRRGGLIFVRPLPASEAIQTRKVYFGGLCLSWFTLSAVLLVVGQSETWLAEWS